MISIDPDLESTSPSASFTFAGFVIRSPVVRLERMSLPVDSSSAAEPSTVSAPAEADVSCVFVFQDFIPY